MNSWETTRRDVSALCQELWADAGHGHESSNHDLITKIAEVRAQIHRAAEETRQPWGAAVTLHGDLDKAAAAWSERGSEWHRQQQAEAERVAAQGRAERDAAAMAAMQAEQATIPVPGFYWAKAIGKDRWSIVEVEERNGYRFVVHHGDEDGFGAESIAEWGARIEAPSGAG